ncbi:MAG: hypothetical protein GY702_08125 [Desulfobulbaceae bacterium]|nr:hypothetical protein [Desulfobulbaceae bacterium]
MAKNIALIPGEQSNWEVVFFLLVDNMIPFLKSNDVFQRQDIVSKAGMSFIYRTLGSIGYEVNKTLENSLQGTINRMVNKKYILADFGEYTLTLKGHIRLCEIRDKYCPEGKEYIGQLKENIEYFDSLSEARCEEILIKTYPDLIEKIKENNKLSCKDVLKFIIKNGKNISI